MNGRDFYDRQADGVGDYYLDSLFSDIDSLANIVFKAALVAALGTRALFLRVSAAFVVALLGGVAILWWWPD